MLAKVVRDGVCELTLTSAKTRNALSLDLIRELQETFSALHDDRSVRVVVLGAEGPAFCSGHNLKEMYAAREACTGGDQVLSSSPGAVELKTTFDECSQLMQSVLYLNQPVIAKVNGIATAAGCQLVATCDLAFASPKPSVNIGLFCTTPGVALSRAVGRKQAMHMLLTGDMVSAQEAVAIGLLNDIVDEADLDAHVSALAARIATKSPTALRIGKRAFYEQLDRPVPAAYAFASRIMWENAMAEDARRGIGAFLAKATPTWQE
ncbi:Enoyl-CoA hydratase [Achlya hypogyna]|uniref:Enoyl-CoA hydratase domain-containing protein 3, mitochondrial n=1 Tax=Achlya hypogyna TaxID=1202772 RepID=A0A1V9ZL48_ACHHY|nr:Enoyl-CoA hydratase [Achlya hypogyna]